MTSAVRVGGERLYKKAHRGEVVETPERDVEVHRAELLAGGDELAHYEIECSAGTYVRTLIETLDDAYCAELRRTAIGPFRIEDAGREVADRARSPSWSRPSATRWRCDEHQGHLAARRRAAARATSRSAPSTASTSATRR